MQRIKYCIKIHLDLIEIDSFSDNKKIFRDVYIVTGYKYSWMNLKISTKLSNVLFTYLSCKTRRPTVYCVRNTNNK